MTELVNLTPHPLRVYDGDRVVLDLPASTRPARVVERRADLTPVLVAGTPIPLTAVAYEPDIAELPELEDGVLLVVSRVTAAAVDRADLLFPLDEVRDEDGRIVGCRGLGRFETVGD